MARYTGPRFKVARHLGVNVFNHPKALNRGVKTHTKLSEYGTQLLEKQKLKMSYGVLEKQFNRYVKEAMKSFGNPGEVLVQNLERRLDNVVYRLGFALTLRQARQIVNHGHVLVNGAKVDIPSYRVNVGDKISLKGSSDFIKSLNENFASFALNLSYLEKDENNLTGWMCRMPVRDEIPAEAAESKIIEFYSRN